ncbi:MAG: LytR/AlgR family response regulator transcription factor [Betaproteobacteria bacterium]
MTRAIVADDEPHLSEFLAAALRRAWPELELVGTAANGPEALALIRERQPEVAFLDIRMPGATGLEVAREAAGRTRIVFVTAYEQHALEAFERDAVDYLLKPVSEERLARCVAKLRTVTAAGAAAPDLSALVERLGQALAAGGPRRGLRWIRAGRRTAEGEITEQIPVEDVVYFQADDKYTAVHARVAGELREWLIRTPLSELAAELDPDEFVQVHRSVIVRMAAVAGTRRDLAGKLWVRLRGVTRELPVARQYAQVFRAA